MLVPTLQPLAAQIRARLVEEYRTRGFAIFRLASGKETDRSSIPALADALGLEAPFVPPLYGAAVGSGFYDVSGVNTVTAARAGQATSHPAFESFAALELHTDGTLQQLGEIPTSILLCARAAKVGGMTVLFDAVNAFAELGVREPSLTRPLLDPRALTRHATVDGSRAASTGPVFAAVEGEILSRYSTTARDEWNFAEVEGLRAAHAELALMTAPSSPHLQRFRLRSGEGIVFANDRLAHGRTAFRDDPARPRLMLRGLFLRRPC